MYRETLWGCFWAHSRGGAWRGKWKSPHLEIRGFPQLQQYITLLYIHVSVTEQRLWKPSAALSLSLAAALQGASKLDKLIKLRFSWPMECSDRQLGRGRAALCGCYFSGPKWPPGKTCGGRRGGVKIACPACCSSWCVWSIACHLPPLLPPRSVILWLLECHQPPIY